MGELISLINLDKKEAVPFGDKFTKAIFSPENYGLATLWLTAGEPYPSSLGWGQINLPIYRYFGRWKNDRIAVIGEYSIQEHYRCLQNPFNTRIHNSSYVR